MEKRGGSRASARHEMNKTGKGLKLSDAIVIMLFIAFLLGGGYYSLRALQNLSAMDFGKTDMTVELQQWEKLLANRINDAVDNLKAKTEELTTPAVPAATPATSGLKESVKKAELKNIKLYEAGKEIPAVKARSYSAQFSRQARLVYVEISYKNNNYKISDSVLPVTIQYYGPSGQILAELKATAQPKKDWASAIYTRGWGPPEGTPWQAGTYIVKVILDGETAGETKFDIL